MNSYEKALELTGGELTPEQTFRLTEEERAVRFVNIGRVEAGLDPIEVDVETAIGYVPPPPAPELPPAPTTYWVAPPNSSHFDDLHGAWEMFERGVTAHVGTRWSETVRNKRALRTFTKTDAAIVCFAIRYQAATYEQYARMLNIAPKAAQRRIKILERGGYLITRVANPFQFRIASPTLKSLQLVGLKTRVFTGAESQLVHRLMVTDLGLTYELGGMRVLSEYVIGIDPYRRFLFPAARRDRTETHRPDLVVEKVDPDTGEVELCSVEYERTRKSKQVTLDALWATSQSGRVDAVVYISAEPSILQMVERLARLNHIAAETYTHHEPLAF